MDNNCFSKNARKSCTRFKVEIVIKKIGAQLRAKRAITK